MEYKIKIEALFSELKLRVGLRRVRLRRLYAVLKHQPSLYMDAKENLAVLVEGRVGESQIIFLVGRSPQPSVSVSEIAESVGQNISDILESLIREAIRNKKPQEDVLDWLSQSMSWNYSLSEPSILRDSDTISAVAFKLFSQYVAGADQLVELYEKASHRQTRPADVKVRIGETFLNLLQVPGPELVVGTRRRAARAST